MKSIAFGELISFRSPKTEFFAIVGGPEFRKFGIFLPIESAKFHVIQDSELRNVLKWPILHF